MQLSRVLLFLAASATQAFCFSPSLFIAHRRYVLVARHANSNLCGTTELKMSSTQSNNSKPREKAGTTGYSILRQPLNWDTDSDPRFAVPSTLDETQNSGWLEGTQKRPVGQKQVEEGGDRKTVHTKTRKRNGDEELNLHKRTLDTLDYPVVLYALREECVTVPARAIIDRSLDSVDDSHRTEEGVATMELTATTVHGVHRRYQAVKEMERILSGTVPAPDHGSAKGKQSRRKRYMAPPPFAGTTFDLQHIFEIADLHGGVLGGPEIFEVASTLETLENVYDWCEDLRTIGDNRQSDVAPFVELPCYGQSITLDCDLKQLLDTALDDDTGFLSGTTFPGIGRLRTKVRTLKQHILDTLDTLLATSSMKSKLSLESGGALYSEVNGRIVIPVDQAYKNSLGIMHDTSRSGKTAYVEPAQIVGLTNDMRQTEVELQKEEARIWRMLTNEIIQHREEIEKSIAAVAQLDLVMARLSLGITTLSGVIPHVGNEGVMQLTNAKHPILLLRELDDVVGSDINLGANGNQGLVLTGPNAGGKTVILKLLGLLALMVRDGIPIPAAASSSMGEVEEPPRVDFFGPVLADIGDLQSVDGDLSTFSGHMLVCRQVLANSGKNALVLMDELGSGTDPAQGVAIAQALLEAFVEKGSRVVITTHYMELKQLAASDDRFAVGGMQFVNGRPTYKLLPGVVGESFALAVAERLNLPQKVIARATELLDSETRQMGDLIQTMEDQKALIDEQAADLTRKQQALKELEFEMKKEQEKLEAKQLNARRDEARKFAKLMEEKETILEEILEKLKSDPSKRVIAKSWDDIRYVRRDALTEAENFPSVILQQQADAHSNAELIPLSELRELPVLGAGDTLVICKKGSFRGKKGKILNMSGNKIEISVRGMGISMKLNEVALPPLENNTEKQGESEEPKMSKMARKALADGEMEATTTSRIRNTTTGSNDTTTTTTTPVMMRLQSNTVNVLGCTFAEAKQKCENQFSRTIMLQQQQQAVVYILHGHGTQGVLKQKIRDWLQRDRQWVKKWSPACAADGGDAFTFVEIKKLDM